MADSPEKRGRGRPPKRPHAGHGEGSIWEDKQKGVWRGQLQVGWKTNAAGARVQDRRTWRAPDRERAEAERRRLVAQWKGGRLGAPGAEREPVGAYLIRWLEEREPVTGANTQQKRAWAIRLHLAPAFAHVTLRDLSPAHVRRLVARLAKEEISPASLRILVGTLRLAWRDAAGDRIVDAANDPTAGVKLPRLARPVHRPLAPDQVKRFLAVCRRDGERHGHLFAVAFLTGCRPGELLALHESDVTLPPAGETEGGSLRLRRSLESAPGRRPRVKDTKTSNERVIGLPAPAVEALRRQLARTAEERAAFPGEYAQQRDGGLVFPTSRGKPLSERNVQRAFKRILDTAGLPTETRLYDTRHSTASVLAAEGVDPATIAQILGHRDPGFTVRTYVGSLAASRAAAGAKLGQVLAIDDADVAALPPRVVNKGGRLPGGAPKHNPAKPPKGSTGA